jgi:hypothetical protein
MSYLLVFVIFVIIVVWCVISIRFVVKIDPEKSWALQIGDNSTLVRTIKDNEVLVGAKLVVNKVCIGVVVSCIVPLPGLIFIELEDGSSCILTTWS